MSKHIAKLLKREFLTPEDAEKKTIHLEIGFDDPIPYLPGDSIAIDVVNPAGQVEHWLKKHQRRANEKVLHRRTKEEWTLVDYLTECVNLTSILDGDLEKARPLMPRFYSIASSNLMHPQSIHLLVTIDEFLGEDQIPMMGVASHFLLKHLSIGDPVSFKLFANEHFRVAPHDSPMIMIGPGTGVAPFKAFLEERMAQNASGQNWLLFGERNRDTHFYYEDFFQELEKTGKLKLSLAFSRDQSEKIYVQDRLRQEAGTLFDYLDRGATIFICGDAKVMAKSVTETLEDLYQKRHNVTADEARDWLRALKASKRLCLDVY
jgi:sulfite reductase (NADPH) flavoprotein alpha-component